MPRYKLTFDRPVFLDSDSCQAIRAAFEQIAPGASKAIATCVEVGAKDDAITVVIRPRMVAQLSMGKR